MNINFPQGGKTAQQALYEMMQAQAKLIETWLGEQEILERVALALERVEQKEEATKIETLTTAEVAEILHVNQAYVRHLYNTGELRGVQVNSKRMIFRPQDVKEFMEWKALQGGKA